MRVKYYIGDGEARQDFLGTMFEKILVAEELHITFNGLSGTQYVSTHQFMVRRDNSDGVVDIVKPIQITEFISTKPGL